jgi:uncharacterized membrane protein
MRWLLVFWFCSLAACGMEPEESPATTKTVTTATTTSDTKEISTPDTAVNVEQDTSSHASYSTPSIKKPSGIYQFLLPHDGGTNILHTISFYPGTFHLQEEYLNKKDSIVITDGTWAPSQGFIWLYKEQLVRGRYTWKGDSLQYYSPQLKRKFSLTKLTPATTNPVWMEKKKQAVILFSVGNEPFWSIEVNKRDSIVFSMPEWTQPLRTKISSTEKLGSKTIYASLSDSLQVTVYPYFCSDGMSDFIYTNKVMVQHKGKTYQGCGITF